MRDILSQCCRRQQQLLLTALTENKQEAGESDHFSQSLPGLLDERPGLDDLHPQRGQDAKLRASWAHLQTPA